MKDKISTKQVSTKQVSTKLERRMSKQLTFADKAMKEQKLTIEGLKRELKEERLKSKEQGQKLKEKELMAEELQRELKVKDVLLIEANMKNADYELFQKKYKMIKSEENAIERHKYSDAVVYLALCLSVECGCGSRRTATILEKLNKALEWGLPDTPAHTSILNWIQKCGYHEYEEKESKRYTEEYALIVDESMMIGSEKLLLTLAVPALKEGETSLKFEDVQVLGMEVKKSWNSEDIGEELGKVEEKTGSSPAYVISDNASSITKAIRDGEHVHVRDVGHTFGLFLQRNYEEAEDFKNFMKKVNDVNSKKIMCSTAYLLPPKQRAIARFMNFTNIMLWAADMLNAYDRFSDEEKRVFNFIPENVSLIRELEQVARTIDLVLKLLKNEGLSKKNELRCLLEINLMLSSTNERISSVGRMIAEYMATEVGKLSDKFEIWHISSDVLESIFGSYKGVKSPNKMNGVTKHVFIIPLLTRIKKMNRVDFKRCLEGTLLREMDEWRGEHLSENNMVKRRKMLSAPKAS